MTGATRNPRQRKPASAPGMSGGRTVASAPGASGVKTVKEDDHPFFDEVTAYFLAARFHSPGGAFPSKIRYPGTNLTTEAATAYTGFISSRKDFLQFPQTDSKLIAKVGTFYNILLNTH